MAEGNQHNFRTKPGRRLTSFVAVVVDHLERCLRSVCCSGAKRRVPEITLALLGWLRLHASSEARSPYSSVLAPSLVAC